MARAINVLFVALLCFGGNLQISAQKVGDDCSGQNTCTATSEKCGTGGTKCECADNYINKGAKTCISNTCADTATANTCNGLPNFACISNVCKCNDISTAVVADGDTKGSCEIKACSAKSDCTGANTQCSNGKCACAATFELKNGVCAAKACSAKSDCTGANTQCSNGKCACAASFELKNGLCSAKTCSKKDDCTGPHMECSGGKCACSATFELKDGVCSAKDSGARGLVPSLGVLAIIMFFKRTLL